LNPVSISDKEVFSFYQKNIFLFRILYTNPAPISVTGLAKIMIFF